MSSAEIEAIEINIKEAKKMVDLGKSLDRLRNNKDFKKVVLEGFLDREAVRLVHLKADQNMQDGESQASIIKQIDAIGSITDYFNKVQAQANHAERAIEADEQTREELLSEDVE